MRSEKRGEGMEKKGDGRREGWMERGMVEKMWGLRSPTPRGRTESCTLHILGCALLVLTEKDCMWG